MQSFSYNLLFNNSKQTSSLGIRPFINSYLASPVNLPSDLVITDLRTSAILILTTFNFFSINLARVVLPVFGKPMTKTFGTNFKSVGRESFTNHFNGSNLTYYLSLLLSK